MKNYFIILIYLLVNLAIQAQTWVVPAENASKISPIKFNDQTIKKGEDLFLKNCASCHGQPGKNNFIKLVPSPGDPASEKFQNQTDGDLFYKITTGKAPMPQFKDILNEDERWSVISYIRSFNKKYIQPAIKEIKQTFSGKKTWIILNAQLDKKKVVATVLGLKDKDTIPIKKTEVRLFTKRYFGLLPIGDAKSTDSSGKAIFDFPSTLPGNKDGSVLLIARLTNEALGEIEQTLNVRIGVPTNKPALNKDRAMWNVVSKAPIWLLITYSLIVISVWGILIYIVIQLLKLKKIGKN